MAPAPERLLQKNNESKAEKYNSFLDVILQILSERKPTHTSLGCLFIFAIKFGDVLYTTANDFLRSMYCTSTISTEEPI